jgi:hypothetical protein
MNIPIKNAGTKNCLSNAKLTFGKKGTSLHMGKTSTKEGRQFIPLYIPGMNSLLL